MLCLFFCRFIAKSGINNGGGNFSNHGKRNKLFQCHKQIFQMLQVVFLPRRTIFFFNELNILNSLYVNSSPLSAIDVFN